MVIVRASLLKLSVTPVFQTETPVSSAPLKLARSVAVAAAMGLSVVMRGSAPSRDMRHCQPALDQWQVVGGHRAKLIHNSCGRDGSRLQRLDGDAAVGVDANVSGDVERLAHNRLGVERAVGERTGGG